MGMQQTRVLPRSHVTRVAGCPIPENRTCFVFTSGLTTYTNVYIVCIYISIVCIYISIVCIYMYSMYI
jgi:hypothetical protein